MVKPSFWRGWASPRQSADRDFPFHHERIAVRGEGEGEISGELEEFSALEMPAITSVMMAKKAATDNFFPTEVTVNWNVAS